MQGVAQAHGPHRSGAGKLMAIPRSTTITITYHFSGPGRRSGIRRDIMELAIKALIRRLGKHNIVVDSVEIEGEGELELSA